MILSISFLIFCKHVGLGVLTECRYYKCIKTFFTLSNWFAYYQFIDWGRNTIRALYYKNETVILFITIGCFELQPGILSQDRSPLRVVVSG